MPNFGCVVDLVSITYHSKYLNRQHNVKLSSNRQLWFNTETRFRRSRSYFSGLFLQICRSDENSDSLSCQPALWSENKSVTWRSPVSGPRLKRSAAIVVKWNENLKCCGNKRPIRTLKEIWLQRKHLLQLQHQKSRAVYLKASLLLKSNILQLYALYSVCLDPWLIIWFVLLPSRFFLIYLRAANEWSSKTKRASSETWGWPRRPTACPSICTHVQPWTRSGSKLEMCLPLVVYLKT